MNANQNLREYVMDGTDLKLLRLNEISKIKLGIDYIAKISANGDYIAFLNADEPSVLKVYSTTQQTVMELDSEISISVIEWDQHDSRFLVIQGYNITGDLVLKKIHVSDRYLHQQQSSKNIKSQLCRVSIPIMVFRTNETTSNKEGYFTIEVIEEFEGIPENDREGLKLIMDIKHNLVMKKLAAVKKSIITNVGSDQVWLQIAQICNNHDQSQLARLCLGKMKNAKALRTISFQEARNENSNLKELLNIHLGFLSLNRKLF